MVKRPLLNLDVCRRDSRLPTGRFWGAFEHLLPLNACMPCVCPRWQGFLRFQN
jgi:hypothetical protein